MCLKHSLEHLVRLQHTKTDLSTTIAFKPIKQEKYEYTFVEPYATEIDSREGNDSNSASIQNTWDVDHLSINYASCLFWNLPCN